MQSDIRTAVIQGRYKDMPRLVEEGLQNGAHAEALLDDILDAMRQNSRASVPDTLASTMALKSGVEALRPHLLRAYAKHTEKRGKMLLGTPSGELHDIGKMLMAIAAEALGLEVIDLGVDVGAARYTEALRMHPDCRFVGVSAMMGGSVEAIASLVRTLEEAGLRERVTLFLGGSALNAETAQALGADYYTGDVRQAAQILCRLLEAEA